MRSTSLFLLLLAAAFAPACKSKGPKGVGFLDDYSKLEANKERPGSFVWYKPGADLRQYDYLLIDPIVVIAHKGSATDQLTAELKKKATDGFREVLFETIDPYYTVVEKAGLHVLRVRIALTDLTPDEGEGMGSASLEGELLDSRTGDRLAAFVSTVRGSKEGWRAKKKWLAVEGAFVEWSQRLLDYFDSFQEAAELEGE